MPIDKSDIIQNGRIYKYSHAEEIIVQYKIWMRHIWIRQDPELAWRTVHDENRLMDYEPTDRPASEYDGKRITPSKQENVGMGFSPSEEGNDLEVGSDTQPKTEPAPAPPKSERKPKPKLHPSPRSIRDFVRKFGDTS